MTPLDFRHRLLSDMLRDLTARTTLVATLYQSTHDARASCADHARIVAAIERGAFGRIERAVGGRVVDRHVERGVVARGVGGCVV